MEEENRKQSEDSLALSDLSNVARDVEADRVLAAVRSGLFSSKTPSRLGRFLVLERLGAGTSGVVYSAYDPELDRKVAIKVLRLGGVHAGQQERLSREAKAMARLHCENVVAVYEQGKTANGELFVVMQLVDGNSLGQWLKAAKPSFDRALELVLRAGDGLVAAHKAGLVHRDFKPDNVLVAKDGGVRVADFGLARGFSQEQETEESQQKENRLRLSEGLALTQSGAIVGTPDYMAPEVLRGASANALSDQYSFCVTLYHTLCGSLPHSATSISELLEKIASPPTPPPQGAMPNWLWRIVARALSVDPRERHVSVDALLKAIRKRRKRQWRLPLMLSGALLLFVVGGFLIWNDKSTDAREVCSGADSELAQTWNPMVRQSLLKALSPQGIPRNVETFNRTDNKFELYAGDWKRTHREVCLASQRGEQGEATMSLRMRCLDRRHSEFSALLQVLSQPEANIADKALRAVAELTPIEVCNNVEVLQQSSSIPEDPRDAVLLKELEAALDVAVQFRKVGQYGKGEATAQKVLARAEVLKYEPFVANARAALGDLQARMGNYEEARESLRLAFSEGLGSGNDRAATLAAIRSTGLSGFRLRNAQEAEHWSWLSGTMLARLGEDLTLEALLATNRGNVAFSQREYSDASQYFRQAATLYGKAQGENSLLAGFARSNLGATERLQGNLTEAKKQLLSASSIIEASLGSEHPDLGRSFNSIGNLYRAERNYKEAEKFHRKALLLKEKSLGQGHTSIAHSCNNLADVLIEQERYAEALVLFERAHSIWRDNFGDKHRLVSLASRGGAECKLEQGHKDAARSLLEQVLSEQEELLIGGTEEAVTRFLLARTLWPKDKKRALALAHGAKEILLTDDSDNWLVRLEAWLENR